MDLTLFLVFGLGIALTATISWFLTQRYFTKLQATPDIESNVSKMLSEEQIRLYSALHKAIPKGYIILSKLPLSLLVRFRESHHNELADKLLMDFVICAEDSTVRSIVNLDNHLMGKKAKEFVNHAISHRFPVLNIPRQAFYDPMSLAEQLNVSANINNKFARLDLSELQDKVS